MIYLKKYLGNNIMLSMGKEIKKEKKEIEII